MKGLFVKDLCLMKMQKRFFFVLIAIAVMMAFTNGDTSFVTGYLVIVMPMFALSTISYDEFDNGNAFLFTLPITRTSYVLEKYLFSALLGVFSLVIGVVLALGVGAFQNAVSLAEALSAALPVFAVMLAALAVMLPLQLKFGAEKGRIAMIGIFGGAFAVGFAFYKLVPSAGARIIELIGYMREINMALLVADVVLALAIVLAISVAVSIWIMKKKEF